MVRPEQSPRLNDSPFPVFRSDYRYRGVYERAGFDVYKGPNGERLVRPQGHKSLVSSEKPYYNSSNYKSGSVSATSNGFRPDSKTSFYPSNNSTPTLSKRQDLFGSTPSSGNGVGQTSDQQFDPRQFTTRNKSYGDIYAKSQQNDPYSSASSRTQYYSTLNLNLDEDIGLGVNPPPHTAQGLTHNFQGVDSPKNYSGTTAVSSLNETDGPIVIKQDAQKSDNRGSEFNFSPQTNANKNFKNLALDLNGKPTDTDRLSDATMENNIEPEDLNHDMSSPSNKNDTYNSTYNYNYNDTNETSVDQSESIKTEELLETPEKRRQKNYNGLPTPPKSGLDDPTFVKRERLSDALNDFKHDFQTNPYQQVDQEPVGPPTFQIDEPRLSYGQPEYSNSPDPSSQFESFRKNQGEDSERLNTDYENYLNGNTSEPINRKSQMSMVSSIISKESKYSEDGDSEVERELERQLQNLKTGGNTDSDGKINLDDGVPPRLRPIGPSNPQPEPDLSVVVEEPETSMNQTSSYPKEFPEEVAETSSQPENITRPYPAQFPEDDSPMLESKEIMQESSDLSNTTDELDFGTGNALDQADSVVETKVYPNTPESKKEDLDSIDSIQPLSVRHSKSKAKGFELPDISRTPEQKPPEPRNVEDLPEVRMASKRIPSYKYPSGSGPCRGCKETLDPNAKGPQKSIYSKTGELTGQWHRKCFACHYEGCHIQFDKNTQCYVLDDEAYCKHHYHELNYTLCENCRIGIEGECIENELQQKWHTNCLKCFKCHDSIGTDYYLINDCIICEADAMKIMSGQESFNDVNGESRSGLTTQDKVEKRRTRLMHVE